MDSNTIKKALKQGASLQFWHKEKRTFLIEGDKAPEVPVNVFHALNATGQLKRGYQESSLYDVYIHSVFSVQ